MEVYYTPYLGQPQDKVVWWVVMKTKPRGIIEKSHQLEITYSEEEMCYVNQIVDNIQIDILHDVATSFEEIEIYVDLAG